MIDVRKLGPDEEWDDEDSDDTERYEDTEDVDEDENE